MISIMFILMFVSAVWILWKKRHSCQRLFLTQEHTTDSSIQKQRTILVPMQYNNLYTTSNKNITEQQNDGTVDKYEINCKYLTFGPQIGSGAFGQVFKAMACGIKHIPADSVVAVKTVKENASNEEFEDFLREIAMLKQIGSHSNIVTLLGCSTISQPYCIVMEYIPSGDLLCYLHALRTYYEQNAENLCEKMCATAEKPIKVPPSISLDKLPSITETAYGTLDNTNKLECVLNLQDLQSFAVQIARGMRHLESKHIVHRDLAARNILIDESKKLKISDFGLSRKGVYVNSKQRKLPLRWLSIEAIEHRLYTNKSDVWAFGIVLWEIGTLGGLPYPSISNEELIGYLHNGNRLNKPDNCTEELYTLMQKCWSPSIDDRPTFSDLLIQLAAMSSKRHVYVDFSQLNPNYMFPPIHRVSSEDTAEFSQVE